MLTDPMTILLMPGSIPTEVVFNSPVTADLALLDLAPGKTVRQCRNLIATGDRSILSISHSESKENKGQVTDRSAIRLECRKTLEDGAESVAQVTISASFPRRGFTTEEMLKIAKALIGAMIARAAVGDEKSDPDNPNIMLDWTPLSRVLEGEA